MLLNVNLLVSCILIVLVSILYIFYWNRFFGYILSCLLRLFLWTQSSSASWVNVGSVHLSLLAGRVLLKDVRYHSSNQTFRIVKCQISWRYWLRHVAEEEDLADEVDKVEETSDKKRKRTRNCRIHVSLEGFEWFMYNRIAAFENVLAQLGATDPTVAGTRSKSRESHVHERDPQASTYTLGRRALSTIRFPSFLDQFYAWIRRQLPDLDPKNLLPFSLEVSKGAITLGNHATESLMMAQFVSAFGTYGVVQSRAKFDLYKQLLHINFANVILSCVENHDYWASVQRLGNEVHDSLSTLGPEKKSLSFPDFNKLWLRARSRFPYFKSRQRRYGNLERGGKKKGRKVSDEESHIGADFIKLEYAIDRKLLEAPLLELTYYADVAGEVPEDPQRTEAKDLEFFDIGNGGLPPEWGVDVVTHGAVVRYGPWADRQRVQLQRAFFPPTFSHASPTDSLETGDRRMCTCLKLFFEFRGVTTLHLPFREASKNWQWDGLSDVARDSKQREAASLQFRFNDTTTIKYLVPMVATEEGYLAELDVFMDGMTLTSSLNDMCVLEAASCSLSSRLPSPLNWDVQRAWNFDIVLERPVIYLIRDHINMLTDLGKDWASGPPSDYNTFIPMLYGINITFNDFELNFYANDHNIIDRPLDRRENVLFTYKANVLQSNVAIPLNRFRPFSTTLSFVVNVPNMTLLLSLPRWNTHALSSRTNDGKSCNIAHFPNFCISGSYTYHSEIRNDCVDQLKLDIQGMKGHSPTVKLIGCVVRHFMTWRENYFGSFTQYSTTREYIDKRDRGVAVGDPLELKYRPGRSNGFHLDLSVVMEDTSIILPACAPGYSDSDSDMGACVILTVPSIQVQMRLHEYFMDLSINIDPVVASIEPSFTDYMLLSHSFIPSQRQLSISGLDITANRLFGPPPRNTAYVCVWNIHVGVVKGFFTVEQARTLLHSGRTFMVGYTDPFNSPAMEYAAVSDRDATFLKVAVDAIEGTVSVGTVAARATLAQGANLSFNNIAGKSYRKMTTFDVPIFELQILYSLKSSRQWLEVGMLRSSVGLDMYNSPSGWHQDARLQRQFIEIQDLPTNRFKAAFGKEQNTDFVRWRDSLYLQEITAPSMKREHPSSKTGKQNIRHRRATRVRAEYSDSDQELISEMDRDRRLADSRPNSFAVYNEGSSDQSVSSLHESDETNETDAESFWSDFLEPNEGRRSAYEGYLSFCRRFQAYRNPSDQSWVDEFAIYKEATIPRLEVDNTDCGTLVEEDTSVVPSTTSAIHNSDDSRSRSNLRAKVDDTEVFITALVCPAIMEVLNALRNELWIPELKLDDFALNSLPTSSSESNLIFDLQLRRLAVRIVKDLLPVDEMSEVSSSFPGSRTIEQNSRVMGILDTELLNGRIFGNYIPTNTTDPKVIVSSGSLGFQSVRCSLGTHICSVSSNATEDYCPSIAAQLDMDSLLFNFSSHSAECLLSSTTLRLHHHSPEVILVAIRELQADLQQLNAARRSYAEHSRLKLQHLILLVFDCNRDKPPNDVFAAIQPSFLVQSGRPQKLRQDANWKLLFYLRHMLADMSEKNSLELNAKLASGPGILDIRRALEKYNIPWATEEGLTIMGLDVIRSLFEEQKSDTFGYMHRNDTRPAKSARFKAGSLKLFFVENKSSQNSFTINDAEIRADLLMRRMIIVPYALSSHSATFRSASHDMPVDYGNLALIITLSVNSVQLTVFPTILTILQNAIHVWSALSQLAPIKSHSAPKIEDNSIFGVRLSDRILSCDARIAVRRMLFEAAAENLIFEVISRDFSSTTVGYVSRPSSEPKSTLDISFSHFLGFEGISVKARTRLFSEARYRENDVLAGLSFSGGSMCALYQSHSPQGQAARSTVHVDAINLNVPRSAIRLYHFAEQWRQDYLLGVDTMMKSLFSEIRQTPKRTATHTVQKSKNAIIYDLNGSITTIAIDLQVMHGTWLSWSAHEVVAFGKNQNPQQKIRELYGLQVGSQKISISSGSPSHPDVLGERSSEVAFILPEFSVSASLGTGQSSLLGSIGFLEMTIKPSHWDALLSVQQKFGQDFNDLLLIIGERGRKRTKSNRRSGVVSFNILGKFDGFRIGLEGHSSTQFLQCDNIDAVYSTSTQHQWQVTLTDLTLYLAPKASISDRTQKVHFPLSVTIDLRLSSYLVSAAENVQRLDMTVTKLHAILQASMMSEIGDFVDYLQSEVLLRKEQRAIELNEFKGKARKIMQTFNINPRQPKFADTGGFFVNRMVKLSVKNIVAVIPLELDSSSKYLSTGAHTDRSTRAFMACIDTLSFQTQRGETGQAVMNNFCFQFVSRFNASNPPDFNAAKHKTTNKLFYPEMTARMQTETSGSGRKLVINAGISGFVLDLDPSITAYAFAVVDVFRQGKQGVERLTAGLPRASSELDELDNVSADNKPHPEKNIAYLTTEIHGSLKFSSGSIRLHGSPMRDIPQYSTSTPEWLGMTYQIFDPDIEQFNLPELSVHCDYLEKPREAGVDSGDEHSSSRVLMFKSTIHSSSNTLRPSLLPFLTELVHNIEERMRASSSDVTNLRTPSSRDIHSLYSSDEPPRSATRRRVPEADGLQIIFSLRIDKSHLELTCKPDVNVVARLHWESGGFLINISPGSKGVSVSASIGGLTAGLRHGFLNEDSTSINARNLNFSVNFSKSSLNGGQQVNSVSVVVETEVAGNIRFTRLQDFMCFKAVWLDHIPIFKGDAVQKSKTSSRMTLAPSSVEQAPKQGIDTAIIVRVRQIRFEADLGQSISTVTMELQSVTVRTRMSDDISELAVAVERVDTQARGNLSGHLRMPDFLFRTVRKRQDLHGNKQPLGRMLELFLTSGTLDVQLQSDWLWLLQYRAEPFQAMVHDDWPTTNAEASVKDRQLQLSFTVSGTKVTAMLTIMAIPKLVMYAGKFMENLEAQREGASRESSAFRSARLPKPDNALSEVAHAMFETARTKLKETESLSYVIGQRMSLDLRELVFVLLPRSQGDHELARFIGRDIKAQLRRTVKPDGPPVHRDLRLSMSHMSISQLIKQGFDPSLPGQEFDVLTESSRRFGGVENVIFSLPAIDMRMVSDEELQDGVEVLPYDFVSNFVQLEGQRRLENISISFNIGLYSWLTVLRKTLTRELKRAQEVAEWRAGAGNTTTTPSYTPRFGSPPMASTPLALERAPTPIRSKSLESVFVPSSPGKRMSASRSSMLLPSPRITSPELFRASSFRLPESGADTVPTSPTSKGVSPTEKEKDASQVPTAAASGAGKKSSEIVYKVKSRKIERLTVRQLGEATPDVMHPFFTKKAGFNLEESLPQYVHEYATLPIEEIMKALVKLYSKQLKIDR